MVVVDGLDYRTAACLQACAAIACTMVLETESHYDHSLRLIIIINISISEECRIVKPKSSRFIIVYMVIPYHYFENQLHLPS
jgi:hypothetical protein